MSSASQNGPVRLSVLDRLIGPPRPPGRRRSAGLGELRACVVRDLEWLLNTRVLFPEEGHDLKHARASLLSYGVPDLSTVAWSNDDDRARLARTIEGAIQRFEPRLAPSSVRVDLLSVPNPGEFRLRYRIRAVLHVEPVREPVVYDTDLDIERGTLALREVG